MNKTRRSIALKSISGIVLLLVAFSIIVSVIGYRGFTQAMMEQYAEMAFRTASIASYSIDADLIDEYLERGAESEEFHTVQSAFERICRATGVAFVYVIRPDLTDYGHITFVFSASSPQSGFTPFESGYVRETTNDEYRRKYRALFEGQSTQELVMRDYGRSETGAHITAMIPLKGDDGETKAILCVQRQMEEMTQARISYVHKVLLALLLVGLIVVFGQYFYLNKVVLNPIKRIQEEASRFARENVTTGGKLSETITNRDEIGVLAESIDQMEEQVCRYVEDLTRITKEKERSSVELSLASRIQANVLPDIFPPFPDRTEFDLYAVMKPAREVGGDFFDYYLRDEDHLYLAIADVSGKGVPAALFMMAVKIMLSNTAMADKSPAEILEEVNHMICGANKEEMFVTAWLGIYEISTGLLTAANAGHEYPVIRQAQGNFELFKDKHDLVIGSMDGVCYHNYELTLEPGARLFVYTDGLTEASDENRNMFGTQRLVEALNHLAPEASPKELLEGVEQAVAGFVGKAEQFDDMTMLCLEIRSR